MIRRIYTEKKSGFRVEADQLYQDIRENLRIRSLEKLRILNRYDIEGISEALYRRCLPVIFFEPPVDNIIEEELTAGAGDYVFAVQYLPGQYDQRADSAVQCIQIMALKDKEENEIDAKPAIQVETAKVYVLTGSLEQDELERIKKYCINPVESREASLEKPAKLGLTTTAPKPVAVLNGFINKDLPQLLNFHEEMSLAMSLEDLLMCQNYFADSEHRNPTITELRVIDTYWSDHCRHSTFSTEITDIEIERGKCTEPIKKAYALYKSKSKRKLTLMDIATTGMKALKEAGKLRDLDESDEINACSINVEVDVDGKPEPWLVMFKNETHNHPTEIEPFGGAATCLGGAIRDPLSGRSYVYQALRLSGSSDPREPIEETIPGKLPQSKITTVAAHGFSSYGNQIGLATGLVSEIYHRGYAAKRMEAGAVIGAAPKNRVVREKPIPGDIILLVGGRTGRDGIGGASGSSQEHRTDTILNCGAQVQKGNPPTERKLQRLFRNTEASRLIKRCNDFGAGGVCVAIGELAEGLNIDLDVVPKKYDGLDGTELAISESQERMAVVIPEKDLDTFIRLADEENLEATAVAEVTDNRRLIMNWQGKAIVDISRDFLDTNGAAQTAKAYIQCSSRKPESHDHADLLEMLGRLNCASQKGLGERFDSTIGTGAVLMPFGGKNQLTPIEAMAAKIPVERGETSTCTLMSYGYDPELSCWSPFHGALYAVIDSIAKVVAAGGDYERVRLSFQEYFERLDKSPEKWGKPLASLLGGFYAQMEMGIPAIGGKDSMSGSFRTIDEDTGIPMVMNVPPTLISFALGIGKVENIISPEWKKASSDILLLEAPYDEQYMPDFEILKSNFTAVHKLIEKGKILSASTVGYGGIAAAAAKRCFGNEIGFDIRCEGLYRPRYGCLLLEWNNEDDWKPYLKDHSCKKIGGTISDKVIKLNGKETNLKDALKAWMEPLEKVFPTGQLHDYSNSFPVEYKAHFSANKKTAGTNIAKPGIFIPVFPGTNCEYDTARAFEKAGGRPDILVMRNLNSSQLEQSVFEMEARIRKAQIIAIPGGFSAGDEPDGSAKFITAVFQNPYIADAVRDLLHNRDGLMLGICNGFQALIKLGLVVSGDITGIDADSPTLTYNSIGRHISCIARTKIISNKSPWLWSTEPGQIHPVALSHGEGRFVLSREAFDKLEQAGQIAAVYVDPNGQPSMDIRYNPNGSYYAVECVTSPDGRILGKMGHSERVGNGLYKNVASLEEMEQGIFASGVRYFS